jgi:hypothetical protein
MAEGMFRTTRDDLGECVRMKWGSQPESFLTKDTYKANRHDPPYDELPTREEYMADRKAGDDA